MNKKFAFSAVVSRVVTDDITLYVSAGSEAEARSKATEFLHDFPKESIVEGVSHAYIENREQSDIQITSLEIEQDRGVG